MILAFQLEDHVVPVEPAERLAPAPFDPRHPEHGGLDYVSLARQLVEQRREPGHARLSRLRHVVRLRHTRRVFGEAVTARTFPLTGVQTSIGPDRVPPS
jgi:hypothetical protein